MVSTPAPQLLPGDYAPWFHVPALSGSDNYSFRGAIVFSCSLLHEANPVTSGTRYAFLPFLYDDAAAEVRQANRSRLADAAAAQNAGS